MDNKDKQKTWEECNPVTFYKFIDSKQTVVATFAYVLKDQEFNACFRGDKSPGVQLSIPDNSISTDHAIVEHVKIADHDVLGLKQLEELITVARKDQLFTIRVAIEDRITAWAKRYLAPRHVRVAKRNDDYDIYF